MSRFLPFSFVLAIICLNPCRSIAQSTKLEVANIWFSLPDAKWKLAFSDKSGNRAAYAYQRDPMAGDNAKPSISFMIETLSEKVYANDYLHKKLQEGKINAVHFGSGKMGLVNARTCKAYFGNDSLYFGVVVNGLKAVVIVCEVKGSSFRLYDQEFLSFLASLSYTSETGKEMNNSKPANPTDNAKSKTAVGETINACDYFPVKNGMRLNYTRNDMTGQHPVIEQYNVTSSKTLKSGKVISGYKIKTTIAARNNTVIYYYCDNGSVKMYSEMPSYNTYIKEYLEDYSVLPSDYNKPDYQKTPIWETEKTGSGKYLNFTELKAGNTTTQWTDIQIVNENPVTIVSKIVETGLNLTVQGKLYSSVIHVIRTVTINFQGEDKQLNVQDIYYAKGIGKIKVVEKGNDLLLGGSFTTTQELMEHNLPAPK